MEYNPLKDYMNGTLESYPDEDEIRMIMTLAKRQSAFESNVGIRPERMEFNEREKAFHDEWLKENKVDGFDRGLLQTLFIEHGGNPMSIFNEKGVIEIITERDRKIVATVIQWLGSNVGMCFLENSLARFGAQITYKKD